MHGRSDDAAVLELEFHLQAAIDRQALQETAAGGAASEAGERPFREIPAAADADIAGLVQDDELVEGVSGAHLELLELFEDTNVDGFAPVAGEPGIERCGCTRAVGLRAGLLEPGRRSRRAGDLAFDAQVRAGLPGLYRPVRKIQM